ncbi:MAG: HAD family hydrolase [Pirellulaceae bacterium]
MTSPIRQLPSVPWAHEIVAVAFDMDGLLVNTEDLYSQVGDIVLKRRGRRFTPELKNRMMGLPASEAFQAMIDHEKLTDSIATLADESEEIFDGLLESDLQVLPGVFELLEKLDSSGAPRCVATSSTPHFAKRVLTLIEAHDRFDFVITAQDVENGKPAPDIYLAAAERMGAPIESVLVLEDSHHGSQAGARSGACTIAVPGDHSRDHDFDHVFAIAESLKDPLIMQNLPLKST